MKVWTVLLASVLALGAFDAEAARRLGGGGSIGRQSSNVTQRQASPAPASPAVAPSNAAKPAPAAPATTPAAAPRKPWAGILGGLAAGLGLAWLAHTLGFGEAFGQFMLFALLALVIMVVIGMVMRRRAQGGAASGDRYAYQGASADAPVSPPQYNPSKIGNDASARPWERATTAFEANRDAAPAAGAGGIRIGSALETPANPLAGSQQWGVPAGFDTEGFLAAAKRNFVTLQDAWDRADLKVLRGMMTDEMMREIEKQPATGGKTEVVMLEAQLLGIEESPEDYLASVEFSGMIREDPSAGPSPFREVWNMVKPRNGSAGWLVAGVQALQ
ncbi:Tim44-like domain-containing protein [Ramlibacter sp. XY19]|uniref:Tim44 domain-containing protein n=1 Tax=Ramlibacter paludis TaxID=2908000 RepID=UPI0023DB44AE|nr:Tim44-like domain-containing protein [Ramlibacter paludis]MCG2592058.1 Tim44-like domain-containing protein [Ramlibacter paludis]